MEVTEVAVGAHHRERADAPAMPMAPSHRLLLLHVALVTSLGQFYGKFSLFGVFPTELALGLMLLSGWNLISTVPRDRITKLAIAFIALGFGWAALSGLGSTSAGPKALSFFIYGGFYFVARSMPDDAQRTRVLTTIALSTVAAAALGFFQQQTGNQLFRPEDFGTTLVTTSTGSVRWLTGEFTMYAMFGLIILGMKAILERRMERRSWFLVLACAAVLVLGQQRSAIVTLVFTFALSGFLFVGSARVLKMALGLLIFLAVGLLVFTLVFGSSYLADTLIRAQSTTNFDDENIAWRLLASLELVDGIIAKPLGHGFATWDFFFNIKDPLSGSHNSFLDLGYRIGVPGLLIFLAMPITFTLRVRRAVKQLGSARAALIPITACSCLIAFLAYSAFNVVFDTPYMSVFFWILLGIGMGSLPPEPESVRPT